MKRKKGWATPRNAALRSGEGAAGWGERLLGGRATTAPALGMRWELGEPSLGGEMINIGTHPAPRAPGMPSSCPTGPSVSLMHSLAGGTWWEPVGLQNTQCFPWEASLVVMPSPIPAAALWSCWGSGCTAPRILGSLVRLGAGTWVSSTTQTSGTRGVARFVQMRSEGLGPASHVTITG